MMSEPPKPTRRQVENAFQPAKDADNPARFAGRESQVSQAFGSLLSEGVNLAVIGNRGVGKTSLARQLASIAAGENQLLEKLGIAHDEQLDFITAYFACSDSVDDCRNLLWRLLSTRDCLGTWMYDIPAARKEVQKIDPSFKVGGIGLGGSKQTEVSSTRAIADHDVEVVFLNALKGLADEGVARDGILVVIDEFDRIRDPAGFASFLKSVATNVPAVRFCIVGVAHDLQQLMAEHESSDRLFAGGIVHLPPMDAQELKEIVTIAEESLGGYITFEEGARDSLVALSQGHPYMVHLIGKYALRLAHEAGDRLIREGDIDKTLRWIAENAADPILEDRYKNAIRSSAQCEVVLKAMALGEAEEVHTGNAYKVAIDGGVENPSQYVGTLVTQDRGAELVKVRDRYYRFRDTLFRAYVSARPALFAEPG